MRRVGLVVLLVLVACQRYPSQIHFNVPNGFTGWIAISVEPGYGSGFTIEDGAFVYEVPDTGVLCVGTLGPFEGVFRLSGTYQNGEPIYGSYNGMPKPPSNDAVLIQSTGMTGVMLLYIYVGSRDQFENRHTGPWRDPEMCQDAA